MSQKMRSGIKALLGAVFALWLLVTAGFVLLKTTGGLELLTTGGITIQNSRTVPLGEQLCPADGLISSYLCFFKLYVTAEWGNSFVQGRRISEIIAERLPRSLLLLILAAVLSRWLCTGLLWTLRRSPQASEAGELLSVISFTAFLPGFSLLVIWIFAFSLGWFPPSGLVDETTWRYLSISANTVLAYLALSCAVPVLVWSGVRLLARQGRSFRSMGLVNALAALGSCALVGALWKTLGPCFVMTPFGATAESVCAHDLGLDLLWHLALPALTLGVFLAGATLLIFHTHTFGAISASVAGRWGFWLALAFSGVVIVERLYSWPGLGMASLNALGRRDFSLIVGAFFSLMTVLIVLNFIVRVYEISKYPRVSLSSFSLPEMSQGRLRQFSRIGLAVIVFFACMSLASLIYPWMMEQFAWDATHLERLAVLDGDLSKVYDPKSGVGFDPTLPNPGAPNPPSLQHPLGTSDYGPDILSQLLYSARWEFILMILASLLATVLGVGVAWLWNWWEFKFGRLSRVIEMLVYGLWAVPCFVVIRFVTSALSVAGITIWDLHTTILAIALFSWPLATVVLRARLSFTRIAAAFCLIGSLVLLTEATLSFFGLLANVRVTWGMMLGTASTLGRASGALALQYWWVWVPPFVCIWGLAGALMWTGLRTLGGISVPKR